MVSWKIGEVEIFQITEIEAGSVIQGIIKEATPENIKEIPWLCPLFADNAGKLKALVQSFLVKSDGKFILVDACNGNGKKRADLPEWGGLKTNFLQRLEAICPLDNISSVICTHMHFDHVGWNTSFENGAWIPTFPNVKYLFVKDEYNYWSREPKSECHDDRAGFDDSVLPVIRAGRAELLKSNHRIDRHLSLVPTPGHTPGHVSVMIESQNQRALISGDFLYHPCQIAHPEWTVPVGDPEMSKLTLKRVLHEIADTGMLLIGSHFSNPVAGYVMREKDGYRLAVG